MLETSARLLRLLSLFQGRRYWSGAELADRLEVTPRTLRRDVDKLRTLGYPIGSTTGVEGGYQLGAGSVLPPLLLDDDEAVAVVLGLQSGATGTVEGIEEASMRALSKIEQVMPPRLARRVAALQSAIVSARVSKARVDARIITILAGACRDQESLQFRYQDHSAQTSSRSVEPHRLVHNGYRWYLVAWDSSRQDWRTFRVDRIQRVAAGSRFPPRDPPSQDLVSYVARGVWNAPPCRAQVILRISAEALTERWPPGTTFVEPLDQNRCKLEIRAATYEHLAMYLLFFGVDFEVSEPPELIHQLSTLGARIHGSRSHD